MFNIIRVVFLVCIIFIPYSSNASSLPPSSTSSDTVTPHMVFDDMIYDFGIAGPKEKLNHTFTFTNIGSAPLKITRISTSCGCLATLLASKVIPSGGHGEIKATFDTKDYEGEQEKTITVYSNDPDNPSIELTIFGRIKRDVTVIPQGIHFGNIKKGETKSNRVQLLQLSSNPLILNRIEVNEHYLNTETSIINEENKKGFNIDISLKPKIPVGEFSEIITLHTNLNKRPRIDVPVWANILGRIKVQPQALSFGTVHKGDKISPTISVSTTDSSDFQVEKVVSNLPFIHLEQSINKKDRVVEIAGFIDNVSPAGMCSGSIEIHTDDPEQGIINVPIYGVIK